MKMGPKKKSKNKKLVNVSEEERMRYLQHKAAMEEEAYRRKYHIIATYMNVKLKHEEAFTRLNSAKINQQWRHILRQIKCEKLKKDVKDLEQHFDYVLDSKNMIITELLSDFDNAEFQYSVQFQEHTKTISKFLGLHRERLLHLHEWYTQQVQTIRSKHCKSKTSMLETIQSNAESIIHEAEIHSKEHEEKLKHLESSFDERRNDLSTKLLYRSVKMEEKYANELVQLQREYNQVLEQYKQNTESKLAHYKIFTKKDNEDSCDILQHYEKTQTLDRLKWIKKSELNDLQHSHENKLNELRAHKSKKFESIMALRQELKNKNQLSQWKLKLLVNTSNGVIKELTKMVKDGDHLFQVVNQCLKLTSGQGFQPIIREKEQITKSTLSIIDAKLNTFWRMRNATMLANESLLGEKLQAQEENNKLQKLLIFHMSSLRRSYSMPRK